MKRLRTGLLAVVAVLGLQIVAAHALLALMPWLLVALLLTVILSVAIRSGH